jgi:hypothetical protein
MAEEARQVGRGGGGHSIDAEASQLGQGGGDQAHVGGLGGAAGEGIGVGFEEEAVERHEAGSLA